VGGFFTSYLSWRYVFAGEVLIVLAILVLARRMEDVKGEPDVRLDLVGTALSAFGLGLIVCHTRHPAQQRWPPERPDRVLLAVLRAGRAVLRRSPVPVRRTRALGH
jgi:hypothetical protein